MKEKLLLRKNVWQSLLRKRNLFVILTLFTGSFSVAQINIAPQAVVSASNCSTGPCSAFNDLNFGTCGSQLVWISTSNPPSPTPGVNWIQWDWTSPQSFDEIIIHHASATARSLTGGLIQFWDGTNWVNHHTFSNLPQACINSVAIPRLTTARFRITSFEMTGSGQTSNPNFREIEIISAPTGPNDAGVSALISPNAFCIGTEPVTVEVRNYGTNRIDSVFVNWQLNGLPQTGAWLTTQLDTLNGLGSTTANITLGNLTLAAGQSYAIKAWTSLPNNAADTLNFNDTLEVTATTVVVGTVATSKGVVCSGEPFNLTISPLSSPTGQQFQWQVSTDNINWTNLSGATTPNLMGHIQTGSTYYRLSITCNGTTTTNSVFVETNATPISGTVTINSALPTGSGNFASFSDLMSILNCSGINGPLVVNVVGNSGPYNEMIQIGFIGGSSSTNTITINGNGNILQFDNSTSDRAVLRLSGTKHLTLDSLQIKTLNATVGWGIHLTNQADSNTIKRCTIDISSVTSTTAANSCGIAASGSNTSLTITGNNANYNLIEKNTILGSSTGGAYQAITFIGSGQGSGEGNIIRKNTIKDFHLWGIRVTGCLNTIVENNDISRENRTSTGIIRGIYLTGATDGVIVRNNRIHDLNNSSTNTSTLYFVDNSGSGSQANPTLFYNNLLYAANGGGLQYGFHNSAAYSNYYHNTVVLNDPDPSTTAAYAFYTTGATNTHVDVKNNIFFMNRNTTSNLQYAIRVNTATVPNFTSNNNAVYMGTGAGFGFRTNGYPNRQAWNTATGDDANSNEGDPIFVDPTNGDLTPGGNAANNMGANLLSIVPNDYFDIARTTTPDAGAIEFTPLPCLPPFNVNGNVGTNRTIAMGWAVNPDADSVKIEWGPSGFQPGTGNSVFSTTGAYTITQYNNGNLQYNSCYDVYLTSYCGGNSGIIRSGPFTYCMPCGVFATPFFENFDGTDWRAGNGTTDKGDIDGCWDRLPGGSSGSAYAWYVRTGGTGTANTGPSSDVSGSGKYLYVEANYGVAGDTAYLSTPFVDLSNLTNPSLTFSYHMFGTNIVHIAVDVWKNGVWDKGVFILQGEQQNSSTDAWRQAYIPLSNYIGDTIKVQFRGPKGGGILGDYAIDEVGFVEFPNCLPPVGLKADSLWNGAATFSWASFGNRFELEWGLPGFIPGSGLGLDSVKGIPSSPHSVTNLVPGITMHVYVRDTCDPSGWAGPLLVTIPADHDASLIGLIDPSNTVCGDSAMAIEIEVKNNGLQPITNLPITVTFSGDITGTFSSNYTNTIPSGATVNIVVGTYNTYSGGNVDIDIILNMANDQNPFNDSSLGNSVTIIPYEPQFYTPDLICAGQDTVTFKAKSLTGVVYAWFQNQNDSIPFQTGDSLKFPTGANNNTYYLRYLEGGRDSLTSTLAGNTTTGTGGNMFDLNVKNSVNITAFSVRNSGNTTSDVAIYYKVGSLQGHENNQASWTLVETVPNVVLSGTLLTKVNLTNPLFLPAGQIYGIYIQPITGSFRYSSGNPLGSTLSSNNDLDFIVGVTKSTLFGSTLSPRTWNGIIHYGSNSCSDITVEVKADSATSGVATAMATFNLQPAPSLDVDFDASGSQNGHVYDWDFGDGNTIQTTNPLYTHTYAQGGNYTVTLTVIDTVCGTTDQTTLNLEGVSVSSYALVVGANLFPNPSTGIFTLTMDLPSSQSMTIRIVDMLGRQLWKRDYGNVPSGSFSEEFNLNRSARGVYLLEVTTTNGKFTKRVVLE